MTRQVEQQLPAQDDSSQIANVGKLVEEMELKMRNLIRTVPPPLQILVLLSHMIRC